VSVFPGSKHGCTALLLRGQALLYAAPKYIIQFKLTLLSSSVRLHSYGLVVTPPGLSGIFFLPPNPISNLLYFFPMAPPPPLPRHGGESRAPAAGLMMAQLRLFPDPKTRPQAADVLLGLLLASFRIRKYGLVRAIFQRRLAFDSTIMNRLESVTYRLSSSFYLFAIPNVLISHSHLVGLIPRANHFLT